MASPGVETRPLKLISGNSPFCETFFTDVKVPKKNLVGKLNGGWDIAKRLLQYERQNISAGGFGGGGGNGAYGLEQDALEYVGTDGARIADADLRARICAHKMEARAFTLTVRRAEEEAKQGKGPGAATSIIKYAAAKINQDRTELMVETLGHRGLGWEGDAFKPNELAAKR